MNKFFIHNLGDNSILGFFAELWLKNDPDIAFNEYMERYMGNTEITAYFYPSNNKLDDFCIQKNKNFCDRYSVTFILDSKEF